MPRDINLTHLNDIHPVFALWMMPWALGCAWTSALLGANCRNDAIERNPPGTSQLPVPPNIQDSKDREIFA